MIFFQRRSKLTAIKTLYKFLVNMKLLTVVLTSSGFLSCANLKIKSEPPGVYVLGSIHSNMLVKKDYTLQDFISVLYLYKPTLILAEVRPEFSDAIDGVIHGAVEQSIVYAYAEESGAKVVPIDWHNDKYNLENDLDYEKAKAFKKEIQPLFDQFKASAGSLSESQSPETQNIIRKRYDVMATHGLTALRKRDAHICENIKKQRHKISAERVLIVFGVAHKYYLEDCIRELGFQPLIFKNWYNKNDAKKVIITKSLVENSVKTLKAAKELSRERLKVGFYKTDVENLNDVLKDLDEWIKKIGDLTD